LDDAVRKARKHFQSLNWTEKESDFILGECSASESKLLSGLSDAFTRSDIVKDVITEMVRVFRESQKEGQERDRKARAEWAKGNVKKVAKNALLMTIPCGVLFTRDSDYSPEPTRSWSYWGEVGMSCKNESLCAGLGDEKILGVVSAALSYTETHDALMAALKESITELRRKECFSK